MCLRPNLLLIDIFCYTSVVFVFRFFNLFLVTFIKKWKELVLRFHHTVSWSSKTPTVYNVDKGVRKGCCLRHRLMLYLNSVLNLDIVMFLSFTRTTEGGSVFMFFILSTSHQRTNHLSFIYVRTFMPKF